MLLRDFGFIWSQTKENSKVSAVFIGIKNEEPSVTLTGAKGRSLSSPQPQNTLPFTSNNITLNKNYLNTHESVYKWN